MLIFVFSQQASGPKDQNVAKVDEVAAEPSSGKESEKETKVEGKKKANRCGQCRAKIGVLGMYQLESKSFRLMEMDPIALNRNHFD